MHPMLSAARPKSGIGIEEILEHHLDSVPPPKEPEDDILRALVFDSHYDPYRGVMVYMRVISGEIAKGSHHQNDGHRQKF